MLEVLFNFAGKAFSKEGVESARSFWEMVNRIPEWEQGSCSVKARIPLHSREQAGVFQDFVIRKMQAMQYASGAVDNMVIVFREIVGNAFRHGCHAPNDKVTLAIEMSEAVTTLRVMNPPGAPFDVIACLREQKLILATDPLRTNGRGLLQAQASCSSLEGTDDGYGVKCVIINDHISVSSRESGSEVVIRIDRERRHGYEGMLHLKEVLGPVVMRALQQGIRVFHFVLGDTILDSGMLGVIITVFRDIRKFSKGEVSCVWYVNNYTYELWQQMNLTQLLTVVNLDLDGNSVPDVPDLEIRS